MLEHRSLPVAKRESFAACGDRQRVALGMQSGAMQIAASEYELAIELGARAWHRHLQMVRLRRGRIEQVQVCASMVDHALSVAGQVTCVEVLVFGMAAQVFAQGRAG